MSFVSEEMLRSLPTMSHEQLDALPCGAVMLDDAGIIGFYNHYAMELTKVDPMYAFGKNFFTQVAPSTNNRLVYGVFKEGVKADSLNAKILYTLTYIMRPTLVNIRLYRDPTSKTNWVLVQRDADQ
jgi:photoactive yellow protein